MRRLMRAVLGVAGFLLKAGLLLAVAGVIAALSLWHTVDSQFRASEVKVPDVRGLTLDEATSLLARSELGLFVEARRPHESVAPGLVTYQDPVPGASTRKQRMVKVTLSAGQQLATVPKLVGRTRREATIELRTEHVTLGQVLQVSAMAPADEVLAQSPAGGAPLEEGGRVDLLVSAGPRRRAWVMPDLRGRPASTAREALAMAGLRIASEREQYEPGVAPGFVRGQDPLPGTRVLREAGVSLTVSRGPEPPVSGRPFDAPPAPPAPLPGLPTAGPRDTPGPRMP